MKGGRKTKKKKVGEGKSGRESWKENKKEKGGGGIYQEFSAEEKRIELNIPQQFCRFQVGARKMQVGSGNK